MSQRSAMQLELHEQCHSPSFVLIESRRLLMWVRSKVVAYALLHALLHAKRTNQWLYCTLDGI